MQKKILHIVFITFLILFSKTFVCAQYITIPDPAFRTFIATTFPAIVNGANQLDTNQAKTITGPVEAVSMGIASVLGIEYFININRLTLSGNIITSLPPDIIRLTKLIKLELDTNKLVALPDLHSMTLLEFLYCQHNEITVMPSMANMTSVQKFFCHGNRLTVMPDLTGMTSLNHFICSDNFITSIPDMSTLTSLNRFLCTNNKLTSVVNLTSLPNVTEVHLRNNNLSDFPIITGMNQLTELRVDGNNFQTLPDMSGFVNLATFHLQNNLLTFEDLLPLSSLPGFSNFVLAPQKNIGITDTLILKEKGTFNFSTGVDLSVSSNNYQWFKNGVQIGTSSTPQFFLSPLQFTDAGEYYFQITNSTPGFTSITLQRNPIHLKVVSCMDLTYFKLQKSQSSCHEPYQIEIDESTILNYISPLRYSFRNILSNEQVEFNTPKFSISSTGLFELTIADNSNCIVNYTSPITLERNIACDPVIYPDLTGKESSYFITQTGEAIVYSSSGLKMKSISIPGYWDGKDQQGKIVDTGYYMIIINGEQNIPISVMRTP